MTDSGTARERDAGPSTPSPRVTVVVATYNRPQLLRRCLTSLLFQSYPRELYRIVAVDDGSTDLDLRLVAEFQTAGVTFLLRPHEGICATKNAGIHAASTELCAFLDDDFIATPTWLEELLRRLDEQQLDGVSGRNLAANSTRLIPRYCAYRRLMSGPIRDASGTIVNATTGNACFRRDALTSVNGFNTDFTRHGVCFGADDVDITYRLLRMGYRLGECPLAVGYHHYRSTVAELVRQNFGYGRGIFFHCAVCDRAPEEVEIFTPTPRALASEALRFALQDLLTQARTGLGDGLRPSTILAYSALDSIRHIAYWTGIVSVYRKIRSGHFPGVHLPPGNR